MSFFAATLTTVERNVALEIFVAVTAALVLGAMGWTTKRLLGGVKTLERLDIAVSGGRITRQNPEGLPLGLQKEVEIYRKENEQRRELSDRIITEFAEVKHELNGFTQRLIVLEDGLSAQVTSLAAQLKEASTLNHNATKEVAAAVKSVAYEVRTNGGTESTIGDGVKRIEAILTPSQNTGS